MTPEQHIDWLVDNTTWLESVHVSQLATDVPCCPGWVVENVINHLSIGVGLAYPLAIASSPNTPAAEVFARIARPAERLTGDTALATFAANMRHCIELFSATDPKNPCWTYAGPGTASFWFRRAAIETALHRIDVEEALLETQPSLSNEKAADAIRETIDFALPLAIKMVGQPAGRLVASSPELDLKLELSQGPEQVLVEGIGQDVLLALWGRQRQRVAVSGDQDVTNNWLSLIERAFAGRVEF